MFETGALLCRRSLAAGAQFKRGRYYESMVEASQYISASLLHDCCAAHVDPSTHTYCMMQLG